MEEARGLQDLSVVAFESRRATEMAELIRRHGGEATVAPSMREAPLQDNTAATELLERLSRGEVDIVVFLTGVGARALAAAVAERFPRQQLVELLGRATLVARGPKPVAALREMGLKPEAVAPEPNTWREVLATLDEHAPVAGRRVAVQEYGASNPELVEGLAQRGADVLLVPVYQWAWPEDTGPLRDAVRRLASGEYDLALFTSATQVEHVVQISEVLGLRPALASAASRTVFASVGPVCSEALRRHGLPVDVEPEHPKMGQLVAAAASRVRDLLAHKRPR